ncbi:MAG: thiol:disulfide interchange protein DsbG [Burkholderiaceae bacterium]
MTLLAPRSRVCLFLIAGLALLPACGRSQSPGKPSAEVPAAVKALEGKGLTVMQEFEVGGGLRAFAAVAGDRPVAVYVTSDGNAIVGSRLDDKGEPLDEATLDKLVAKPISDKAWAQLEASRWVRDGKADAPRIVYTFSDANCPYCHRFWEAARPWVDAGKVQLRHVLVGVIRPDSPAKAAAILGAADPSAALAENENKFDRGGITPAPSIPADVSQALDDNQRLMLSMGFRGTPGIVVRDGDGLLKKYNGMPQPAAMNDVLGPR